MEEDESIDLEAVKKVRETGVSRMIIGEILCLFAYIACPPFLLPMLGWSQPQIDEAGKGRRQGWKGFVISEGGIIPSFLQVQEAEGQPHISGLGVRLQKLEGDRIV